MMHSTTAEVWFRPDPAEDRFLPEGPRQCADGAIVWVCIQQHRASHAGTIQIRETASHAVSRYTLPGRPGFVLPTHRSHLLFVSCENTLGIYNTLRKSYRPLVIVPDMHPRAIINDAEPLPDGSGIVFGTKDTALKQPIAKLYLYTLSDNAVTVLASGFTCSNGKVFRSDGTLLDIDTPAKQVRAYTLDIAKRTLDDRGVVLDLTHRNDYPDGMIATADDELLIAFYNPEFARAGQAIRFRIPTGEILETIDLPGSPRVTCPLLALIDHQPKLIFTTAVEGMTADMQANCPNAGALFIAPFRGDFGKTKTIPLQLHPDYS